MVVWALSYINGSMDVEIAQVMPMHLVIVNQPPIGSRVLPSLLKCSLLVLQIDIHIMGRNLSCFDKFFYAASFLGTMSTESNNNVRILLLALTVNFLLQILERQ